ncbi:sulfatase-like hydrolase/transferase [Ornithinimicrobium sp. INDO-MA30-4]|uniref:sulfatase-like hydrolase/transferase n=1 Tax=Ornithinimicrobium sp. INDO-MA30-4 TaxID=2908651 RepID=UPI0021A2677C|nr:sulfatase-like hydrolase/transferase [Ornithinimicrobium sp. INDO-MA30-4]
MSGPYDHWPTGEGFEKYYGFLGGETDNYNPTLFEGTTAIDTPDEPGYHLSEDLATRTISYIREQKAMTPDKPFFTYLSFGATHAPHHAPPEYVERYSGAFDHGWDKQRELTLAKQNELGVVPEDAELTPRPESIPDWEGLDEDRHRLFSRMMEGYAGFATHTDEQVGRVVDALEDLGELDNTLIFYVLGDNGASGEGGPDGSLNEYAAYNLVEETVEEMITHLDEIGSDRLFNHYTVGWAHAMNTPYQWTKQIASHWGGTRTGMIVHWPGGIEAEDGIRDQFTHVIDIASTILEAAGIPEPTSVNGVAQKPIEGTEFNYAFDARG